MTHEMALKLAQAETPEQMADRIVELYETIDDLRASLEQYRNGYEGSCMACEPVAQKNRKLEMQIDDLRAKLATAREALQFIDEAKEPYPGQRLSLFYARRAAREALDAIEEEE